jgi:hypothetical protein
MGMKKLLAVNLVLTGLIVGIFLSWACSSPSAQAATGCAQWETEFAQIGLVEPGWEPFGGYGADNSDNAVMVRRCVP